MLNDIRIFLRPDPTYQTIFNAEEQQFQFVTNDLEDLKLQLSVDTATWGLVIYEKELKIKTDLSKPLGDRRSVIKSRLRGTGKVDAALIKVVCDAYTNGQVDVSFNGRIVIKFNSQIGTPPNIDDLKAVIDDTAPAHLGIEYQFRYLLIKDIHEVMTLEQLETQKLDNFAF